MLRNTTPGNSYTHEELFLSHCLLLMELRELVEVVQKDKPNLELWVCRLGFYAGVESRGQPRPVSHCLPATKMG